MTSEPMHHYPALPGNGGGYHPDGWHLTDEERGALINAIEAADRCNGALLAAGAKHEGADVVLRDRFTDFLRARLLRHTAPESHDAVEWVFGTCAAIWGDVAIAERPTKSKGQA